MQLAFLFAEYGVCLQNTEFVCRIRSLFAEYGVCLQNTEFVCRKPALLASCDIPHS
ncbi:hypothetical protein HNQ44_001742 [Planomicrobium koreense]|uniref:Uncharacterized protein n=1 Tax=Planococcus koreensis TaxID=112331 RepID=A0A7W8CSZ1_9BACL|nr:hypothetical protein [Planococcus koreensis]